jgi:Ras-related protein Rab-1A
MAQNRPLKILIIGDSNVGKTSILLQYTSNFFQETHIATIGVEFKLKEIMLDNIEYKLNIWDTAGQERFKAITKSFFKAADGIVFVYDVTNKPSFVNIKNWIKDAESKANDFKIIIVGNKIDLNDSREVSFEEGKNFAKKKNCPFFESSAKDKINIDEIFITLLEEILKAQKNLKEEKINEGENKIILEKDDNSKTKSKKCCK